MKFNFKKLLVFALSLTLAFSIIAMSGCDIIISVLNNLWDNGDKDSEEAHLEFIDSIGGVSETYKGSVSETEYQTPNDAAGAYVTEEVIGDSAASILNTENKGALSESKVAELNIPTEFTENMVSVEEWLVEYSESDLVAYAAMGTPIADTLNTSKKVTVYIIKYESGFKYFSPAPITGETITKSYYDSIFNYEKYENCTYKSDISMTINMSQTYNGETMNSSMVISMSQHIKYSVGKIYLEQRATSVIDGSSTSSVILAYIEEDENGVIDVYVKTDESSTEWIKGNLYTIGFSSLQELTPFYDQYLDYTYFTKTDYGFKLADENAALYFEEALASAGVYDTEGMNIDMFVKYYVSNGTLSGMREDADIDMTVTEGANSATLDMSVVGEVTCTDYGTTVVEKPFD